MRDKFCLTALIVLMLDVCGFAVTSKVMRQSTGAELLKGKADDVIISSEGTIKLGKSAEALVEDFGSETPPWSINCMAVTKDGIYIGTSPNGQVFRYRKNKLVKIYPLVTEKLKSQPAKTVEVNEPNDPNDPNVVVEKQQLTNEHIFAMGVDNSGKVLIGVSGKNCKLLRVEKKEKIVTVFEPNDANYIFAITTDDHGDIYLGTGPTGKIYKLNKNGKNAQVVYKSKDKNILSLTAGSDGFLYAGSDTRGLIYKIDPKEKTASVLYDSEQKEITSILFNKAGVLFAAATSSEIADVRGRLAAQTKSLGKIEPKKPGDSKAKTAAVKLSIANTGRKKSEKDQTQSGPMAARGVKPSQISHIYKINKDGFVTDVFAEAAVFFTLGLEEQKLFIGSGNKAELYTVDTESEISSVIYADAQASQITAVALTDGQIYLGCSNPAKLVKVGADFAAKGSFESELLDAGQPAKWGKLQIDADIYNGCKIMASARVGNVKDINDATFSDWSKPVKVIDAIELNVGQGRFCQYKLELFSDKGKSSPEVREVAISQMVPNLAPKVNSVLVGRIAKKEKQGALKISYEAKDDNKDKLIYKIEFRKLGRIGWIELVEDNDKNEFEWDSKTVEDGRYEVRVVASDERSNSEQTKLTASRISDPVVVDNTAPVIADHEKTISKEKIVTLKLKVKDEFSAIGSVSYTVDSNDEFMSTLPDDLVYDTTEENFTIVLKNLDAGEHVIAVKLSDDIGNTAYKTFEISI